MIHRQLNYFDMVPKLHLFLQVKDGQENKTIRELLDMDQQQKVKNQNNLSYFYDFLTCAELCLVSWSPMLDTWSLRKIYIRK